MPCTAKTCHGAYPYDNDARVSPAWQFWKNSFNVDAFLGGLIGGVAFLAFVVIGFVLLIRQRKRSKYSQHSV